MRNEDLYLRILQKRRNREKREFLPFLNWDKKAKNSERLLNQVNKKIKDKISLKESLSQFIISDITAFEIYFKDLFDASFTLCQCDKEFLFKCEKLLGDKKFNFHDLIEIKYNDIRLSDIILEFQNFQNLKSINNVFSVVFNRNFIEYLNVGHFRFVDDETELFKLDEDWYPKLEHYLKMRHNLTHDYNPKLKLNRDEIDDLHMNLVDVIIAVDSLFYEEIFKPARNNTSKTGVKKCPVK